MQSSTYKRNSLFWAQLFLLVMAIGFQSGLIIGCPGGFPTEDGGAGGNGDGDGDAGSPDSGTPVPTDGGDHGDGDAGIPIDAGGNNPTDAGEPTDDAGEPTDDAGEPTDDAGEPTDDAGEPTDDAGEPSIDGGNPNDAGGPAGPVVDLDDSNMTLDAPGVPLLADGSATATVTVTLLDELEQPIPGIEVTLMANPADVLILGQPAPTLLDGTTTGTVASLSPGTFTISAMLGNQGALGTLTQTVEVQFTDECVTALDFFQQEIWGPVAGRCLGCHNAYGLYLEMTGGFGTFVLDFDGHPEAMQNNLDAFADMAFSDPPYVVGKPSLAQGYAHEGGLIIDPVEESGLYETFLHFAEGVRDGTFDPSCDEPSEDFFAGVDMRSNREVFIHGTFALTGRYPTDSELVDFDATAQDEASLDAALDLVLEEDTFYDRLREFYNDHLFMRGFRGGVKPASELRIPDYPYRYTFNDGTSAQLSGQFSCHGDASLGHGECCESTSPFTSDYCTKGFKVQNASVMEEPLKLIEYVVRNNLPFHEILTREHTMVNPFTSRMYAIDSNSLSPWDDPLDENEYQPASILFQPGVPLVFGQPGVPHAGILTTHTFVDKYDTTVTNLHRFRSRTIFDKFLGIDLLSLVSFSVDQFETFPENPTMDAQTCRVCHAVMDPVAGLFKNWSHAGQYRDRDWMVCGEDTGNPNYNQSLCVRPPGYRGEERPVDDEYRSLQWLGERLATDERFALSTIQVLVKGLVGDSPVLVPTDRNAFEYEAQLRAHLAQAAFFKNTQDRFINNGYNLKGSIKDVLKGPYFRAKGASAPDALLRDELLVGNVGRGRILPPEQLARKIRNVLGYPWKLANYDVNRAELLLSEYYFNLLYGGIDGVTLTDRVRYPFPIMQNVARRMANKFGCIAVPQDFAYTDLSQRRYFSFLDPDLEPEDGNGNAINETEYRKTLMRLHRVVFQREIEDSDPFITEAMDLLIAVWKDGKNRVQNNEEDENIPEFCQATKDFFDTSIVFGVDDNSRAPVIEDSNYVIRSWMAVLTFMLSDFEFLME
jgi:hypothetical protein